MSCGRLCTNTSGCVVLQAALAASRVSKMGYMVGWVGRNSSNTTTTTNNNNNPLEQQVVSVSCCFSFHVTFDLDGLSFLAWFYLEESAVVMAYNSYKHKGVNVAWWYLLMHRWSWCLVPFHGWLKPFVIRSPAKHILCFRGCLCVCTLTPEVPVLQLPLLFGLTLSLNAW